MTSLDKDGFTVQSLGDQYQSSRKSAPSYGISKVGRAARENVFISHQASRISRIGRESPVGGHVYDVPSSLVTKGTIGMGYGGRTDFTKITMGRQDPEDNPTNDALGILPDSQPYKYRRDTTSVIGTEPRGKLKDAFLLKNHAAAFFGRNSPGPAAVGPEFGPNINACRERMSPARPFGVKYGGKDWSQYGSNPEHVGPGRHDRKDVAIGPQYLSKRRNQSVHAIGNQKRFVKAKAGDDQISKLDAARSCFGKQSLHKNVSEPSVGFGSGSREKAGRCKICMTKLDEGPRANFTKFTSSMPSLPSEKQVMSFGMG
jgi:hypothetical protein